MVPRDRDLLTPHPPSRTSPGSPSVRPSKVTRLGTFTMLDYPEIISMSLLCPECQLELTLGFACVGEFVKERSFPCPSCHGEIDLESDLSYQLTLEKRQARC